MSAPINTSLRAAGRHTTGASAASRMDCAQNRQRGGDKKFKSVSERDTEGNGKCKGRNVERGRLTGRDVTEETEKGVERKRDGRRRDLETKTGKIQGEG